MRHWMVKHARLIEFLALFVIAPAALAAFVPPRSMAMMLFPTLLSSMVVCVVLLRRDPTFDRTQFWNRAGLRDGLRGVLLRVAVLGPVVALAVWLWRPDLFLAFPRQRPEIWIIVMTFYPLLSVYPQEVIYRAFFFHRYERLLGRGWPTILASAAVFGFMHILFRNPIAIVLTLVAGVIFAYGYHHRRSTALAWIDHALWGCLAFTVGLGQFFFLGGIARSMPTP